MAREAETRKDDLRTGLPYWLTTDRITPPDGPMPERRDWDAVVVGGGISGALVTEALTRAGLAVLLLDRRAPVRGSTPASTAMIQHEIDVPLSRLIRDEGRARAEAAWLRSVRAVDDLVELVQGLNIACDMQRKRALYLSGDDLGVRGLKAEVEVRHAAGIACEYLDSRQLEARFGILRGAGVVSDASASANPAQMTAGLLSVAAGRGAALVPGTEVCDMAELPDGVRLGTRDGYEIRARHVVFCTGYEFLPAMESRSHSITSTWALASRAQMPRPGWMDDFLVWEASDPYLYFRTTPDGTIIAGGEDEDDAHRNEDAELLDVKARRIARKLRDLTGVDIGTPERVWSAPFGNTKDGLPIIDRVPGHERVFAVMGFGGNGITFSMIAAQIVAAAIDGRTDPDAGVFAFR